MELLRRGLIKAGAGTSALAMGGGLRLAGTEDSTPEAIAPVTPREGDVVEFSYLRPTWGLATFTKDGPYQQQLQEMGNAAYAQIRIESLILNVAFFHPDTSTTAVFHQVG